jgi:hypothetical protein
MGGQIVADLKYVAPLRHAADWHTFAAPGPGSRRGLNRVLGRPVNARWKDDEWRCELRRLHNSLQPQLEGTGLGELHAQCLQNCLCELDKYERARARRHRLSPEQARRSHRPRGTLARLDRAQPAATDRQFGRGRPPRLAAFRRLLSGESHTAQRQS